MRKFLAKTIVDITKFICRVNAPYSIKQMTEERCEEIIQHVQIGDVILMRTEGELTTLFQPSRWTHSLIVLDQIHAFEAKITGTRISDMMYALARCDEAILVRPRFLVNNDHLVEFALSMVNRSYDFSFESSDDKLYCHEAVCKILEHASGITIPQVNSPLGKKWLPSSVIDSGLFDIII